MIANTSLPAFSTVPGPGAARPASRPAPAAHPAPIHEARGKSAAPVPLQVQPGKDGTAAPDRSLPRGSLLNLSV